MSKRVAGSVTERKRDRGKELLERLGVLKHYVPALLCLVLLSGCATSRKLVTSSVAYQSVKTRHSQPAEMSLIPDNAKIVVAYYISEEGKIVPIVINRTSEIMIIDQTMSFFINSDGRSTSYYDPTVRTTSTTELSSSTSGASVNLGAVAGALGIGGTIGQLANGVNVGGAGTSGSSTTNTTYVADQPRVSIGPYGQETMPKVFDVKGLGEASFGTEAVSLPRIKESSSYCCFSICISYSLDGGNNFDKLTTFFYADSKIIVPVKRNGLINNSLRELYTMKPDAINEPFWLLTLKNNSGGDVPQSYRQGILFDYQ